MPDDDATPEAPSRAPSQAQVDRYAMLRPMVESALNEMREFSKKKQDGIVNSTKVKLLNRLLREAKEVLEREPSNGYLDLLDEDTLPQNGDVVLILGQYKAALEGFHKAHYRYRSTHGHMWITQELLEEEAARRRPYSEDDDEFDEDGDSEDLDEDYYEEEEGDGDGDD